MPRRPHLFAGAGALVLLGVLVLIFQKGSAADNPTVAVPGPTGKELSAEGIADILMTANKPIRFYAKAVDQNGAPLAGVKLSGHYRDYVRVLPTLTSDRNQKVEITTDAKGLAQFIGVKGEMIYVEAVSKPGYLLSPKSPRGGTFSDVDPEKPVVFRMWKSQGADRLVGAEKRTEIPYDGTAQYFDLHAAKLVAGFPADLKVTLERTPRERKFGSKEKYDWAARLEVPDGGLIQTDDEFMFMAPESGYSRELTTQVKATDPDWVGNKKITFYIMTRGHYGRGFVEFRTGTDHPKTLFVYSALINPTGSRNLEYDSRQITSRDEHFPPK